MCAVSSPGKIISKLDDWNAFAVILVLDILLSIITQLWFGFSWTFMSRYNIYCIIRFVGKFVNTNGVLEVLKSINWGDWGSVTIWPCKRFEHFLTRSLLSPPGKSITGKVLPEKMADLWKKTSFSKSDIWPKPKFHISFFLFDPHFGSWRVNKFMIVSCNLLLLNLEQLSSFAWGNFFPRSPQCQSINSCWSEKIGAYCFGSALKSNNSSRIHTDKHQFWVHQKPFVVWFNTLSTMSTWCVWKHWLRSYWLYWAALNCCHHYASRSTY